MEPKPDPTEYCRILTLSMRATYEKIDVIFCPILNERVYFNARGFHHLSYNSDGTPRDVRERIHKLALVPLIKHVLFSATGIEEERDIKIRPSRKKNALLKDGKTFALKALVGKKKPVEVRVILLRIGNGKLTFRSVMRD